MKKKSDGVNCFGQSKRETRKARAQSVLEETTRMKKLHGDEIDITKWNSFLRIENPKEWK